MFRPQPLHGVEAPIQRTAAAGVANADALDPAGSINADSMHVARTGVAMASGVT